MRLSMIFPLLFLALLGAAPDARMSRFATDFKGDSTHAKSMLDAQLDDYFGAKKEGASA